MTVKEVTLYRGKEWSVWPWIQLKIHTICFCFNSFIIHLPPHYQPPLFSSRSPWAG